MVFRDDKDALAQRLADLESDLKAAREGLDRKDEELRRLRERLGGIEKAGPRARPLVVMGAVSAALVVAGAAGWVTLARRGPPPVAPMPPPEPPPPPAPPPPPPIPAVPAPPPPPVAPSPRPSAELVWKATARSSRGTFASVRAGSRCLITVDATGGAALDLGRVAVSCGEAVVYDSAAPATGTMMSQTSGSLREQASPAGGFVYQLLYQDTGTRSLDARPQLEIGTAQRIARVFHDGALGGSLDLAVEPASQPRVGESLVPGAAP